MRLSRTGAVVLALAFVGAAATWPDLASSTRAIGSDDFPAALLGAVEIGLAVVSAWLLLVAATGARLAPRWVRALLFATVAASVAAPAHAGSHDLDGLPLPDRPTVMAAEPAATTTESAAVTVRPGDSLWAIAAEHAPPDASLEDLARATTRWYRENRDVVGPDPDLILPGQQLHPPREDSQP